MELFGAIPSSVKDVKTTEELIHIFNETYSLSITSTLNINFLKNFEKNLKDEVNKIGDKWDISNPEVMWYVLILIYFRFVCVKSKTCFYMVQAIEHLISSYKDYDLEELKADINGLYSISVLKDDELSLKLIPNPSKQEDALPQFGGFMYEAIINNRKRVINILNRCIKKELIDVNELKGYFPTIEIKKKNDIIERMYDVMMQSMTNNMCASGEDVYDFPSASEEEFIEIIQVFHQGLSVVLNIFLNDVSIIEECSERISELIFTDIANKIYYN